MNTKQYSHSYDNKDPGIPTRTVSCRNNNSIAINYGWFFLILTVVFGGLQSEAKAVGGDFKTTDFAAAAPFTYNHETGGGAYNDRTVGDFNDITEQLEGAQFSCGDIVTYLSQIEMETAVVDANQSAQLSFTFLANSTGQAGAAHIEIVDVSLNYGQVENGDNGTGTNPGAGFFGLDSGISDDGGSTVTIDSTSLTGPLFQSGSELNLQVTVDDLEAGESVVLRIDTRLACDPGSSPTGNLQGQLADVFALPSGDAAGSGAQTIPFLRVGDIAGAGEPLLSITKTVTTADGTCGVDDIEELDVNEDDTVKYCYQAFNPGTNDLYDVVLTDDNGTPGDSSDDFDITLNGLANLDGEADDGDLASGATVTGESLVTLSAAGTVVNIADGTGNNGRSGGNYAELTDSDTATVNVVAVPEPPVAGNDAFSTNQDEAIIGFNVTHNDSDPDGNLDLASTNTDCSDCSLPSPLPSYGTLLNNGDGTFNYTPNAGFAGIDTFIYEICDTTTPVPLCDTATVTITVNAVTPANDAPDAIADSATTAEDTAVTVDAASNDTDVDGNLDPLSANTDCSDCSLPSNGSLVNNNDGTFTYTPNENYNGSDSFVYQICDLDGLCDTATVTITVTPVNDAPVANNDSASTNEDTAVNIDATINDEDIDGNLDPSAAEVTSGPSNGTITNNGDGSFTYTPNPNFNGVDSFSYEVCDTEGLCDNATVTINVEAINDTPVANDDSYSTAEDTPITESVPGVLANDSDVDGDSLSVNLLTSPSNGSLTQSADGSFTYTPDANFSGTDSYTYEACDQSNACDFATVVITVTPVNDAPVAEDDAATINEDTPVTVDVLANDGDVENSLDPSTVIVTNDPSNGTVTVNPDGSINYTPDPDFSGTDSFVYQVCDTDGACDTATVTITVNPVNDAPAANDDTATTDEDMSVSINVQDNDNAGPANEDQTLITNSVSDPVNGNAVIETDGTVTYTPDANYTGTDNFTYQVCDSDGLCDTATVTVVVAPLNDAPVAVNDSASTDEDVAVLIHASANDSDIDGNLEPASTTILNAPANGIVSNNGDGTFTYTPDADFNGTDSFSYEICDDGQPDGTPLCDKADVTITVNPVNDVPVANDDSYSTPEDTVLTVDPSGILANDSDIDGDALTVTLLTDPSNGNLTQNADGSFTYTPNPDFNGTDSYTYKACDAGGLCDEATVIINVTAVNDAPVAVDNSYSTNEDTILSVNASGILANDYDVDGDSLFIKLLTSPSHGTLTQNADGSFIYTPNLNYNGPDSYSYEVCDSENLCDSATVYITVIPVNDAPAAVDDSYITTQDTTLTITAIEDGVLDNDIDVDGDTLTVSSYDTVAEFGGAVNINPDGTFSYTPADGFAGFDTFSYTVSDGNDGYDTATVTIEVTAKNGRSISVSWGDWFKFGDLLEGSFQVNNQSGGYNVQLQGYEIIVQYRENGPGKKEWINVQVEGCNFDPAAPVMLVDELWINFDSCTLQADIPAGATVRLTAIVDVYGHKDKGKQKRYFLSRLSKTL